MTKVHRNCGNRTSQHWTIIELKPISKITPPFRAAFESFLSLPLFHSFCNHLHLFFCRLFGIFYHFGTFGHFQKFVRLEVHLQVGTQPGNYPSTLWWMVIDFESDRRDVEDLWKNFWSPFKLRIIHVMMFNFLVDALSFSLLCSSTHHHLRDLTQTTTAAVVFGPQFWTTVSSLEIEQSSDITEPWTMYQWGHRQQEQRGKKGRYVRNIFLS